MTPDRFRSVTCAAAVVLAGALAALSPTAARSQTTGGDVVFRDVRVFDGARVHDRTTVVVRSGRILSVGDDAPTPAGVRVVDGRGRTLLPGLIDAHSHAGGSPATLEQAIVFGVTTTLDMFSDPESVAGLREEQRETGASARADVYSAGALVTIHRGHGNWGGGPWPPTISRPEDAQALVDDRVAEGSDYIKIVYDAYGADPEYEGPKTIQRGYYPSIDRPTLAAVVEAAHRRDRMAVVHVLNVRSAVDALEVGADGLVHLYGDEVPDPEFARGAAELGMFVVPTLAVSGGFLGATRATTIIEDPSITAYLAPAREAQLKLSGGGGAADGPDAPDPREWASRTATAIGQLKSAGVPILAGTDAPNPGTTFGASMHHELELLVDAGLTPAEALTAATAAPAEAFGLDDRGRITPGLRADLVLVEGDPTADVRAARNIVGVWKLGIEVDREAHRVRHAPARAAFASLTRAGVTRISDFEEGEVSASIGNWAAFGNRAWGGDSRASWSVTTEGADGTGHALSIEGTIVANEVFSASGALYWPLGPVDLSQKSEIRFWARGDGRAYRLIAFGPNTAQNFATRTFVARQEWTEVIVRLDAFEDYDPAEAVSFLFAGPEEPGDFVLEIDEISFR